MSDVTSSSLEIDYITLLTTQLQNQNPLEPMDNSDMTAQLAQFSQLSQLENLNTSFDEVLSKTEQSYAGSLLGSDVSFIGETSDGETALITGSVDQVVNSSGQVYLGVGDYSLTLDDILSVSASQGSSENTETTIETLNQ